MARRAFLGWPRRGLFMVGGNHFPKAGKKEDKKKGREKESIVTIGREELPHPANSSRILSLSLHSTGVVS